MAKIDFAVCDEFGVNFFTDVPEPVDLFEQTFRQVQMEEKLGFRYHFIIEHQGNNVGQCQSPSVYLAALAQCTSTIRIGAMIYLLPFHNPIRLAQDAAMVDQLSRGRLDFGAGVGTLEHEFTRWRLPFSERREMGREAMGIIRKAWTDESVTHEGKYWKFDEAIPLPRPYQKPHPPVWFVGRSQDSLEYCAANNYNSGFFLEPDQVAADKLSLWKQLWKDAEHKGPLPHCFLTRSVYVAETDEQAREEATPHLVQAYTYGRDRLERLRIGATRGDVVPDHRQRGVTMEQGMKTGVDFWMEHGLAHVGSPETVIQRLEKQQHLVGFDTFGGSFRWGGLPDKLVENSIRLFGEKVLPAFS